jgi:acylphosphatase
MRLARHFLISGRVQGVGFRFFVREAALRDGIHGWVRNVPDGGVEVLAEGEASAMERFERQLRMGPRGSRVDEVRVSASAALGADTGFEIR